MMVCHLSVTKRYHVRGGEEMDDADLGAILVGVLYRRARALRTVWHVPQWRSVGECCQVRARCVPGACKVRARYVQGVDKMWMV